MNHRQIAFILIVNALVSLTIALLVVWAVEARRPDPEELAIVAMSGSAGVEPVIGAAPAGANQANALPTAPAIDAATAVATPAQAAAADTAPIAQGDQQIYIVQAGDSLSAIAGRFGITLDQLVAANKLTDPNFVFSGQRLIIPGKADASQPATNNTANDIVSPPPQGLQIQTIVEAGNLLEEALQIVNDSNQAVNLRGWRLVRENGPTYTFADFPIFPGGSVWLHSAAGEDTSVALYWKQPEAVWQTGAIAQLLDANGQAVVSYTVQ